MFLKDIKRLAAASLAMIAALALSGAVLADEKKKPAPASEAGPMATEAQSPVPASEAGRFSPEQLRGLLSGRVQVTERKAGRGQGFLLVRRFDEDGRWTGCAINRKLKAWFQTGDWTVAADTRGRGKLFASADRGRAENRLRINPTIIHYSPDTGRLLWRFRPVKGDAWLDWNEGWLQSAWPQIAVTKCPDLNLGGAAVNGSQTAATLEALRAQAPDALLRDLAQPLPDPQARQCEHREEQSSQLCASGTGRIKAYKVYAGRCVDWTTKMLWSGGKLVREETDDSACQK